MCWCKIDKKIGEENAAKLYQFVEGRVVVIAHHLGLPLGALLRVWPQPRHHAGVGVRAIGLFLARRHK